MMPGQTNIFSSLLALQEAHGDFFKRTGTQITDYLQISWHQPITVRVLNDQMSADFLEDIQQKLACYLSRLSDKMVKLSSNEAIAKRSAGWYDFYVIWIN